LNIENVRLLDFMSLLMTGVLTMFMAAVSHDRDEISRFLNIQVPTQFSHIGKNDNSDRSERLKLEELSFADFGENAKSKYTNLVQKITQQDINKLTPERAPGFRIDRAVIYEFQGEHYILSPFTVTEEMCAGHMPGFPILPLAEAGRILAQVGSILVGYMAQAIESKEGLLTPLVYKVGEVISGQQGFLVPGDQICVVAKGKKMRGPLYFVEAHGYLSEQHIFSMPKIHYFLSQDQRLWGAGA
jgi:3-hydroxymyristoyl/3-hydroxydecanoyl-(acyl carrier protein) dehydratase